MNTKQLIAMYVTDIKFTFLEKCKAQGLNGQAYYNGLQSVMIDKAQEEFATLNKLCALVLDEQKAGYYANSVLTVANHMFSKIGA